MRWAASQVTVAADLPIDHWRILPPESAAERSTLKARIEEAGGLTEPTTFDATTGRQLNRFTEWELVRELQHEGHNMPEPEILVRFFASDGDRLAFVLQGLPGREITPALRRKLAEEILRRAPEVSDRRIADLIGAGFDHKTVAKVRDELEGRGEIPHTNMHVDTLGRLQSARRPGVLARKGNVEDACRALRLLGDDAPSEVLTQAEANRRLRAVNWGRYGSDNTEPSPSAEGGHFWEVRCADFRNSLPTLAGTTDLGIVDPPWDGDYEFCLDLAKGYYKALRDGGALVMIYGDTRFSIPLTALHDAGFADVLQGWICFDRPAKRANNLIYGQPFAIVSKGNPRRDGLLHQQLSYPERCTPASEHPYEKPPGTVTEWITVLSPEGGLVVDACCGSGSVGVAAIGLGRRFIGCDVRPECVGMAESSLRRAERALELAHQVAELDAGDHAERAS